MTIPVNLNSHKTQLLLTAAATAFTTYSLLSIYQSRSRQKRRNDLAEDIKRSLSEQTSSNRVQPSPSSLLPAPGTEYAEHLVREQLARNYAFLGEEGVARVRGSSVVVVGCGGVGSWAAVMLARSGVARIRLIDFDYVTLSSLNRHATAGLADVGTPKVQCVARALQGIAPFVRVDPRVELWRGGTDGADLLEGADWVVDAIDNIGTKVELLAYCVRNNIKVFSSMGAGTKSDPTRIQIADLSATHYDPLARAVRQRLRAVLSRSSPPTPSGPDHDTDSDPDALSPSSAASEYSIPVVYSTEVPGDELAKGSVDELAPLRDFRVRILPVLGPLPALFGLHIATYRPLPVRHRKKLYERMWKDLLHRESRIARKQINTLPLTQTDIALLYDDFALGRSIVPPQAACVRPALVRWDPRLPLSLENCVVAEFKEAERAVRSVFATPQDGENCDDGISTNALPPTNDYVDALGEPIDSALLLQGFVTSPEELWGIEAAKIAQNRIAQARRFREWVLQ
ncbi:ubiquitin-protein ligase molybdopterin-converting factor [Lactarius pseudohatsudake]|nr:ubiquitin-protein ligase molybdopterin-converting factor [Lactarius pseudohatsudake]